jgi:sugar-specific transcriptional regulator TrmB
LIVLPESDIDFLIQLGLTKTQAKVYLALLKLDTAKARTIYNNTEVPRPEVYRSLDELQKLGLVEKEINTPFMFHTPPLELCIQILMTKREQEHKEFQTRAKEFLQKIQKTKQPRPSRSEYNLFMIEGITRIEQLIRSQHQATRKEIDILTTSARWQRILHFCLGDYVEALERGVHYRVFVEDNNNQVGSSEEVNKLMSNSNFNLKVGKLPLKTNLAIFDQAKATINFFPSESLKESPLIVTNHPSFIEMCKDHFHRIWDGN